MFHGKVCPEIARGIRVLRERIDPGRHPPIDPR